MYLKLWLLFLAAVMLAPHRAGADTLPLPQADYMAKVSLSGGLTGTMRHKDGKIRADFTIPGMQNGMTGIFDIKARKAVMMMPMLGPKTAMEVDIKDDFKQGAIIGTGQKTGQDKVGNEPCDLWQIDAPQSSGPVIACITSDGIVMRSRATINGKEDTVMEITELSRSTQEPEMFILPADVQITKLPPGLGKAGMIPGIMPKMPKN